MKIISPSIGDGSKLHVESMGDVYFASLALREARQNRLVVIESALAVEDAVDTVIEWYFFPESPEKRRLFKSLVVDSDWCTFSAKRKLIKHIIDEQTLLEGKRKNEFDSLLRKVMFCRNAFAHGDFHTDSQKVWLRYFEGRPCEKELTDDYLTEVESIFSRAADELFGLKASIGAIQLPNRNETSVAPPSA